MAPRMLHLCLLSITLGLALSPDAYAGRSDSGADSSSSDVPVIEETGIAPFDDVFMKAKAIHDTLDSAEAKLQSAQANINSAAGAAQGASIEQALGELMAKAQGNIKVVVEGGKPKLSPTAAVPAEVKTGIAAVNAAVGDLSGVVTDLARLPPQCKELVDEAKTFPGKLNPALIQESGLKPTQLPKVAKTVKNNIKAVAATPERVTSLTKEVQDTFTTITNVVKGGAPAPAAVASAGSASGSPRDKDSSSAAASSRDPEDLGSEPAIDLSGGSAATAEDLAGVTRAARLALEDAEVEEAADILANADNKLVRKAARDDLADFHATRALVAWSNGDDLGTQEALEDLAAVDRGYDTASLGADLDARFRELTGASSDTRTASSREPSSRQPASREQSHSEDLASTRYDNLDLDEDEARGRQLSTTSAPSARSGSHGLLWAGGASALAGGAVVVKAAMDRNAFLEDDYSNPMYGGCHTSQFCYEDARSEKIAQDADRIRLTYVAGYALLGTGTALVSTNILLNMSSDGASVTLSGRF